MPAMRAPSRTAVRIRVIGSGPVALAFALFATRQGIAPAAIEIERAPGPPPPAIAGRLLALSLGTWQLLSRVSDPPPSAAIDAVRVSLAGHPGSTLIEAGEMGVATLGRVVRYGALLGVLDDALARADWAPAGSFDAAAEAPQLTVHAEGDAGTAAAERSFRQSALLVDVEVDAAAARKCAGTAFECFTPDGPLALLPVPEPRRYALVWCANPDDALRRATLPAPELAAELQAAFGWSLGALSIAGTPIVAPLVRRSRRRLVDARHAWIGNAAQTLHPVAGQGLNLGIRDAFELSRCVGDAIGRGLGIEDALAKYQRSRRADRSATIAATDALASVFSLTPLRPLQSLALAALDAIPAARARLARQFMFGFR